MVTTALAPHMHPKTCFAGGKKARAHEPPREAREGHRTRRRHDVRVSALRQPVCASAAWWWPGLWHGRWERPAATPARVWGPLCAAAGRAIAPPAAAAAIESWGTSAATTAPRFSWERPASASAVGVATKERRGAAAAATAEPHGAATHFVRRRRAHVKG